MPEAITSDSTSISPPERRDGHMRQCMVCLPRAMVQALDEWQAWRGPTFKNRSEAIRHFVSKGLEEASRVPAGPRLLPAPPPAPQPPTLLELAAMIRKTAETNPFVRPLADLLEGNV